MPNGVVDLPNQWKMLCDKPLHVNMVKVLYFASCFGGKPLTSHGLVYPLNQTQSHVSQTLKAIFDSMLYVISRMFWW